MLLNSVILILQETLEAALLISVLLAINLQFGGGVRWLILAIVGGLATSALYASQMSRVSEWFEYTGQEVTNALLQTSITLLILLCSWTFLRCWSAGHDKVAAHYSFRFHLFATATVLLAITREGSEILVYLMGFYHQASFFHTMASGSIIGFGIGISVGVLILYGLFSLQGKWRVAAIISILALFAGNMLSQATLQLIQADWIESAGAIWNSSSLLSEESLAGKLMYALLGYEATPSGAQVIAYCTGIILVLLTSMLALKMNPTNGKAAA